MMYAPYFACFTLLHGGAMLSKCHKDVRRHGLVTLPGAPMIVTPVSTPSSFITFSWCIAV